jgi:hypothetical protein
VCDEDEVSTMDVRVRMGDAIDPFQLANGVEAVIGYECQERSNPLSLMLTIQTIHARCDRASECVGGSFPVRNSFASYGASLAELFGESANRSLMIRTPVQHLYLRSSQLCLIKQIGATYARARAL